MRRDPGKVPRESPSGVGGQCPPREDSVAAEARQHVFGEEMGSESGLLRTAG